MDLRKKGRIATNKVRGLGERICKDDFGRRWMLLSRSAILVLVLRTSWNMEWKYGDGGKERS